MKEYPQNTVFPVTLTVDGNLENYTFTVFGKRGSDIDERPIFEGRVRIPTTTSTAPTVATSGTCGLVHGDSNVICHLWEISSIIDETSASAPLHITAVAYFITIS